MHSHLSADLSHYKILSRTLNAKSTLERNPYRGSFLRGFMFFSSPRIDYHHILRNRKGIRKIKLHNVNSFGHFIRMKRKEK